MDKEYRSTTELLNDCTLCPRGCHADRVSGQRGYCGQTAEVTVARAALHFWEEPCLSGKRGSGTVFFAGCALGCIYCQNYTISRGYHGKKITVERLGEIFLELQGEGAHNINLVTPDHFVPQICEALNRAKAEGLTLPVVYNSSAYTRTETLRLLEGYVDIYLPDLKYMDSAIAKKYSACADYFQHASRALREMVRQVGEPVFDMQGMMQKGVLVRHLLLPSCLEDAKNIVQYLHETFGDQIYLSLMNQYTPLGHYPDCPELDRKITAEEYEELVDYALAVGVEQGFRQEGETASESFIPPFDGKGV